MGLVVYIYFHSYRVHKTFSLFLLAIAVTCSVRQRETLSPQELLSHVLDGFFKFVVIVSLASTTMFFLKSTRWNDGVKPFQGSTEQVYLEERYRLESMFASSSSSAQ